MHFSFILLLLLGFASSLSIRSPANEAVSRREALVIGASTLVTATNIIFASNNVASAEETETSFPQERIDLLRKISKRSPDKEIAEAIAKLEVLDPSRGAAAISDQLGGKWELIYSVNAEAFSPLLNLPKPIRPTSLQLIGDAATPVVGEGRIAQLLNFPILPVSFILSSGAVPYEKDSSVLEIFPPFRFDIQLGNSKRQVVESGSDEEFRALNARNEEAQAAGRNLYKQRYLETTGRKGDIRISEVIAGDPVLVGEVFIHRRI